MINTDCSQESFSGGTKEQMHHNLLLALFSLSFKFFFFFWGGGAVLLLVFCNRLGFEGFIEYFSSKSAITIHSSFVRTYLTVDSDSCQCHCL